ncbi:MAG: hypothetical protein RB296_03880 [Acidobacteriota bacterium]|jgi:hypothetical protein|nr:hypothetical protein [Acidobacteriota bacterium]
MIRFVHGINLVDAPPDSELGSAQAIALETIRCARDFAAGEVKVDVVCVPDPGWSGEIPADWHLTAPLKRTVSDLHRFSRPRRLPLLTDILERIHAGIAADFMIFTNADIALLPFFYLSLARLAENGYDAMVINRRTIPDYPRVSDAIPLMAAEIGGPHPGYDCFVFEHRTFPFFRLGRVCMGSAWVGRTLLVNLLCHARRFAEFRDYHLTFHLGDDQTWRNEEYADYQQYNHEEFLRIFNELEPSCSRLASPDWRSYCLDTGGKRNFPFFETEAEAAKTS